MFIVQKNPSKISDRFLTISGRRNLPNIFQPTFKSVVNWLIYFLVDFSVGYSVGIRHVFFCCVKLVQNERLKLFTELRFLVFWIDQDGEGICSSMAKYGNGNEPGNEAGYIVGMSSCYPDPVKVSYGETLTLEFNYSNVIGHTGVMGLFYILVAQQLPEPENSLPKLFQVTTPYQMSV